ncbi:group III truncated hemoglobin [Hydrotalea sp. AMD]|uniref:group III truncated hemoglobin n=1 Tax=Hydrotalea sp. AMD TaxID=2501297 RepID=UPI001C5446EE|nr:group III truncated hemoglobin [Hydrotalea sp. AMD]
MILKTENNEPIHCCAMLKDISNRTDLMLLMKTFYAKALKDDVIQHYFNEIVQLNMEKHLPVIVDFWESVLFETPVYKGNAVAVHQHLHELAPFTKAHFNQWLLLFNQTTDQLFSGNMAKKIKQRAQSIATIILLKTI